MKLGFPNKHGTRNADDVEIDGQYTVGALVGSNFGGTIDSCYTTGEVTGHTGDAQSNPNGFGYIGGLAGGNFRTITHCYSEVIVNVVGSVGAGFGGLVGYSRATTRRPRW